MKNLLVSVVILGTNLGLYSQNIDLENGTEYVRIQRNGESDFSRAFGINSSNHMYIGSVEKTIGNIYFFNKGTDHLMTIDPNGKVGIGTTIMQNGLLTLNGDDEISLLRLENDGLGKEASLRLRSKSNAGEMLHADISLYSTGLNQGYLGFKVPHNNTINAGYDMIIDHNGSVGIGTINPDMKLTVNGNIHTKEVKVDLNIAAPDYVFKSDYNLRSIGEVEQYILENGHLPEIPSAQEFEENGLMLAKMDMDLLKKIEELTLYTITQQKEIERLKLIEERLAKIERQLELNPK